MLGTRTGHQSQNESKKGVREGTLGHHNPVTDVGDRSYRNYSYLPLNWQKELPGDQAEAYLKPTQTYTNLRRFHCIVQLWQNVSNVSFHLSFPSCTQWLPQLLSAGRKQATIVVGMKYTLSTCSFACQSLSRLPALLLSQEHAHSTAPAALPKCFAACLVAVQLLPPAQLVLDLMEPEGKFPVLVPVSQDLRTPPRGMKLRYVAWVQMRQEPPLLKHREKCDEGSYSGAGTGRLSFHKTSLGRVRPDSQPW